VAITLSGSPPESVTFLSLSRPVPPFPRVEEMNGRLSAPSGQLESVCSGRWWVQSDVFFFFLELFSPTTLQPLRLLSLLEQSLRPPTFSFLLGALLDDDAYSAPLSLSCDCAGSDKESFY